MAIEVDSRSGQRVTRVLDRIALRRGPSRLQRSPTAQLTWQSYAEGVRGYPRD